jgi:small subunit ribosomal protein S18
MAKPRIKRMKKPQPVNLECYFCTEKKEPMFSDVSQLMKFISDRGKIMSRSRNGLCSIHQRRFSDAVKYARHLALLPFIVRD